MIGILKKIYTADWILPISDQPKRNGAILVDNGMITDMGHASYLSRKYNIKPHRFTRAVIAPSWVNAHCHLELSHLKNKVLRGNHFVNWVESLVKAREEFTDQDTIAEAFQTELQRQGETGTALIGDITNGSFIEQVSERSERMVYFELLGFKPQQADELYTKALARINSHSENIYLAPHALYSTSADLIKLIVREQYYSTIHLAESPMEMTFLLDGSGPLKSFLKDRDAWYDEWHPPGQTAVKYLQQMGVLNERLVLVHGVHVNHEDLQIIKQAGSTVCLCIRSNTALGSGLPPVEDYLHHQIPLCMGTDSLASNSDLDMNEEVAYLTNCFPQVDAAKVLRMATLNGARALGKENEYGSIEIGKKARFNVFSGTKLKDMDPVSFVATKSWSDLLCF